jgi:hypothetical protein
MAFQARYSRTRPIASAAGTPFVSLNRVMVDTISRVEAWLSVAAHQATLRAHGTLPVEDDAAQRAIDERREASRVLNAPPIVPLDIVLARRAREFASLSTNAGIVDRWTAQLLNPAPQPCNCRCGPGPLSMNGSTAPAPLPALETRVTHQLLTSYRTISKTNTGRLIDTVV